MYRGSPPDYMITETSVVRNQESACIEERWYKGVLNRRDWLGDSLLDYLRRSRTVHSGPKSKPRGDHPGSWSFHEVSDEIIRGAYYSDDPDVQSFIIGPSRLVFQTDFGSYPEINEMAVLNEANRRCRSKLQGPSFNAPVCLGEFGETLDMFASGTKKIARAYFAAKRGKFKQAGQILGLDSLSIVPDAWLTWRMGVSPILGDISSAIEKVTDHVMSEGSIASASAAYEEEGVVKCPPYQYAREWRGRSGTMTRASSARVHVRYRVSNTSLSSATSWGLVNLPAALWELTPFSFLVDRFLPIGDALADASSTFGLTFVSGYSTQRDEWSMSNGVFYERSVWLRRTIIGGFPEYRLDPEVHWAQSLHSLADILSLTYGALRRP